MWIYNMVLFSYDIYNSSNSLHFFIFLLINFYYNIGSTVSHEIKVPKLYQPPSLCNVAQRWTHDGRDLITDYRSNVLLIAFVSLKNNFFCDKLRKRYEQILNVYSNIKTLIIVRSIEKPDCIQILAKKYPTIRFEHESLQSSLWEWFRANNFDHYIFDKCSRLSTYVVLDQITEKLLDSNNLTSNERFLLDDNIETHFQNINVALKSALNYANCGWCQYDTSSNKTVLFKETKKATIPIYNLFTPTFHQGEKQKHIVAHNISIPKIHLAPIPSEIRSKSKSTLKSDSVKVNDKKIKNSSVTARTTRNEIKKSSDEFRNILQNKPTYSTHNQQRFLQHYVQDSTSVPFYYQKPSTHQHVKNLQRKQQQNSSTRNTQSLPSNNYSHNYMSKSNKVQNKGTEIVQSIHQQRNNLLKKHNTTFINEKHIQDKTTSLLFHYGTELYGKHYKYRLHTSGYHKMQAQIAEEKQIQKTKRLYQEYQRSLQIAELEKEKAAQIEQQKLLQQKVLDQEKRAADMLSIENKKQKIRIFDNDPAPLYPDGSENFAYYEDDNEWTTKMPLQTSSTPHSWTTKDLDVRDYGILLPCDSYSDKICYQQHLQLKPSEIHRCCAERIVLTDQCFPDKCTNATQQLCCIQKFLQAKLSCCSDEKQIEVSEPGHSFSQCCYNNFVNKKNNCCPSLYASNQWRQIHELCFPNVDINLNRVKIPIVLAGTSLTTEFVFAKTKKWQFKCKYGNHVPQFSYFEKKND